MPLFENVIPQNADTFDAATMSRLGIYVYALRDPLTMRILYVGKGGGTDTNLVGNDRVFAHFEEATSWLRTTQHRDVPAKLRSILEIWRRGDAVDWFIVRHNLRDAAEAFHVESALLAVLPLSLNGSLDNIQPGNNYDAHGLLAREQVATFRAPHVNPQHTYSDVFIFPIQNALDEKHSPYEAVRRSWSINANLANAAPHTMTAVGVANGISRVVVSVDTWSQIVGLPNKWEFSGKILDDSELLNKNYVNVISQAMGFWMRGNYIGASFDGLGKFQIIRGSAEPHTVHLCLPDPT